MAVRKNARSRWIYRIVVKLPDGSKVRISGTPTRNNRASAEKAERDHIERTLNPPPPEPVQGPTFREFSETWLPRHPAAAGNRPSVRAQRRQHIEQHLIPFFGDMRIEQINAEQVAALFAHLRGKMRAKPGMTASGRRKKRPGELAREKAPQPLAARTIRNVGGTLHRMLVSAVEWGKIAAVPPWPRLKMPSQGFAWYTKEESTQLLTGARDPRAHALLLFALRTGARAGEILALQWADVDLAGRKVHIRRSSHRGVIDLPKSNKTREIPMAPDLVECLKELPRHISSDLVFHDGDGAALNLWNLTTVLRQTAKRAGVRKLRFHDLRHSFASQLVTAGVPLPVIQAFLGHSSIVMTQRYAHLSPGAGADAVNLLCAPPAADRAAAAAPSAPAQAAEPEQPSQQAASAG